MVRKNAHAAAVSNVLVQGYCRYYPDEAAHCLDNLPSSEILRLLQAEPIQLAAEVFIRLNPEIALNLIELMDDDFFQRLFTRIDPVRGITLIGRLDKDRYRNRLELLPAAQAREYRDLMDYPADSAGRLMDTRVTTFRGNETVEEALRRIRAIKGRKIVEVCLVDGNGIFTGVVSIQEIAISDPSTRLADLAETQPICVPHMALREDIVQHLEKQKLTSLPVVDSDNRLLGILRYDALVAAAQREASEDVLTMFGAGRDERALSPVGFTIKKRLPWLQINLATAFLAAAVVGVFEATIAKITALAVFLPVVAGQSGNTGSQALAVTMRGLALREVRTRHWPRIVLKEISAGFFNGCVVALTTSIIAYVWMRNIGLTVVIGISMVVSMVIAAIAGAIIPVALKALGQDPAQSSSIVLTTVTDVIGFMSFLGLATLLSEILHIA